MEGGKPMAGTLMDGLAQWETRPHSHRGPSDRLCLTISALFSWQLRGEKAGVVIQPLLLLIIWGLLLGA